MSCCINTLDLGCFDSCNSIELPFNYPSTGTFTLMFTSSITGKKTIAGVSGEPVTIDLSILLEQADYSLQVLNPDSEVITYTVEETEYNCFSFRTKLVTPL